MVAIEIKSHFMLICTKTNTIRERFYDNVITHDVNLNVTDDEKITVLLSDHRIMKNTANFIIKSMEGRCYDLYLYLNFFHPIELDRQYYLHF